MPYNTLNDSAWEKMDDGKHDEAKKLLKEISKN